MRDSCRAAAARPRAVAAPAAGFAAAAAARSGCATAAPARNRCGAAATVGASAAPACGWHRIR